MGNDQIKRRELKGTGYELFIGALSVLSIANLVMMWVFADDTNVATVLQLMNALMFPVFLGDFIYRFRTAESRGGYFWRGFGWADLLSSLPFQQLKILRIFRLWRVIRLFREFGTRSLIREFVTHRAENALLTVTFLVLCVLEFGSLAVIHAEETSPDANIRTASDAPWWAYVTITTVGYGDRFPVTNSGRIVGIFVLTAGVGLFGTLSGFLANLFLSPPKARPPVEETPTAPDDLQSRVAGLRRTIEAQEEVTMSLKAQLEEIDSLLKR